MPAAAYPAGAMIRRARKLLGLTQQELADKVGVTRTTVDSWENDRSYPKRYDVALEQVLGITLNGTPLPEPELQPADEWERSVLEDRDIPADLKVMLIRESRAARAEYVRLKRERAEAARREAARSSRGTSAG